MSKCSVLRAPTAESTVRPQKSDRHIEGKGNVALRVAEPEPSRLAEPAVFDRPANT